MNYFCCTDDRRDKLREDTTHNGIAYVRVLSGQQMIEVHFFHDISASGFDKTNFRIEGGERITPVRVIAVAAAADLTVLNLSVDRPGDFSTYTLSIVTGTDNDAPPPKIDPVFAAVPFSFKVECPTDFDCKPQAICPRPALSQPQINYLSKDYSTFRQLILDRLALLMPDWTERHPADIGVMLAEVLAYVGDYLSYRQDAVATEAYLGTARLRTSVRRHARLVDYVIDEGCNACVWIHVHVDDNPVTLPAGTQLFTKVAVAPPRITSSNTPEYRAAIEQAPLVFETRCEAHFFPDLNRLTFYTFGESQCCLPKSATSATLHGWYPSLHVGAVLIFEEVLGPLTGERADADPTRRHAVKLTSEPVQTTDDLYTENITNIAWSSDDALPFPLCISTALKRNSDTDVIEDVTVACGNVVLADHGQSVEEDLPDVPKPSLFLAPVEAGMCDRPDPVPVPVRYRPRLNRAPITISVPYDEAHPPVSARLTTSRSPKNALPDISLKADSNEWKAVRDLLASRGGEKHFVIDVENDAVASLRFGDNEHGLRPDPGTQFHATYRFGTGTAGNAGADTIVHIVTSNKDVKSVRNPLPASGGTDPESLEHVRESAPCAFRTQERAVTLEDYGELAARNPAVQKAAAVHRWTGSWRTVYLAVDALGGTAQPKILNDVRRDLDRYRLAGRDLDVQLPTFVSLEIDMTVCVQPDHFRSDVEQVLRRVFSSQVQPDGRLGTFHPDNFTLGQPVYLSRIYTDAQRIEGVRSVQVTVFQRQGISSHEGLDRGVLTMHPLEIARLDNDLNFPEHGVFRLKMLGGK